jgi:molecular chaperone GrpE
MTTEDNLPPEEPQQPAQPKDTPAEPTEAISIEAQLALALADASSARDQYLRSLAEQDNIRKRATVDVANARDFASKGFAMDLLAVRDTLEAVLADKVSTPEQLKMGVDMTLKQLIGAFDRNRIKQLDPVGKKFDPNFHQAMQQVESDLPEGTVVQVFQKGYTLADRMLRPAMVTIAKPPVAGDANGDIANPTI